jgi:Ribbon-helix-helix protein, copG family.
MKTASFELEEEQLDWLKRKALESGNTSRSAALRKVIADAMKQEVGLHEIKDNSKTD